MQNHRGHPSVTIPQRSRSPAYHPPEVYSPYPFEAGSLSSDNILSAWDATPTARRPSATLEVPDRPLSRARSTFTSSTGSSTQPEIHRSASQRLSVQPNRHRLSKSETVLAGRSPEDDYVARSYTPATAVPSFELSPSRSTEDSPDSKVNKLTRELSNMTLQSEEGLKRFQNGSLDEKDEAWHSLVPPEARDALGKREVERQCVLFEVFKSERDYVYDLHVIRDVFVEPLRSASPPVISPNERLQTFLSTVFWNLEQIINHHNRLVEALFARQREQHPLVQSVYDIILESFFQFKLDYESYIEHYPLAEQRHRTELNHNKAYQNFMQRCSRDPRTKKRDLVTFLSRPVTRLPRLNLILEHLQKQTESDHPDAKDLPVVLGVLNDFLKSTQPGIAAAESKVKFWNLCDSLAFNKGEIIELALYSDARCLVHAGTLARRSKSDMDWNPWYDLHVALLDNFLLITKEERLPGDAIRRLVVSRPIPLAYLRLGSFDGPPENRKERPEEGSFLRVSYRPMYPFTVYHAFEKATRRYTLYASTEAARTKWHDALVNTKAIEDARREGNQFFVSQVVDDGTFRVPGPRSGRSRKPPSGRVIHAVPFIASGGKKFMAICCASGIFIGRRGETFRKILSYEDAKRIIVLQDFNKVLIHHGGYLLSYSLEVLARVVQYQSPASALDASLETIAGQEGAVVCCEAGKVKDRTIVVFAVKGFLHTNVYAVEVHRPNDLGIRSQWTLQLPTLSFRPYGEGFYIPQDAYSITTLTKTIAVATDRGIVIADPQNTGRTIISIVPDFSGAPSNSTTDDLKARCEAARPLGLVPCDASELMVIYDTMGCYITKHGQPSRNSSFVRWEIKADSFLHRAPHVLLFCSEFIEVRNAQSGKLDQVIEGADIRLLYAPSMRSVSPLVAWRGGKDDEDGLSEQIVELIDTEEITPVTPASGAFANLDVWDEWEM
ncbi:hypothetical protein BKA82DRAFT_991323 [Pisolithus tinctorius]|uniref:DH domain-containing protein n=1 Tax=Pisolithus tinctorius Marx 270 TaxID=870435 RepID=A0A0C3PZ15_PISTI|nr:hypothetical protein BKA82DRAFT_991323 [Pisolithus tinctorius]KIO14564.1 hypothetical protein M404DRAFT_991323 [Pisolithus tinctorius Marx 270]